MAGQRDCAHQTDRIDQQGADPLTAMTCPPLLVRIVAAAEIDLDDILLRQQPTQHHRGQHGSRRMGLERFVVREFQYGRLSGQYNPELHRHWLVRDLPYAKPCPTGDGSGADQRGVEVGEGFRLFPTAGIDGFKGGDTGFDRLRLSVEGEASVRHRLRSL